MFVTFTYLFLFVVDADLRSVCVGTSPWIWFALHSMRFSQMFWKIAVWMQSATDYPALNLFFLLPRDIRFSTNEGVYPPVYSEYTEDS